MNSSSKVFGSDDLRKEILSFFPKRCRSCHGKMNRKIDTTILRHRDYSWRAAECNRMDHYCNWCYYYVFEYR